MNCWIVIPIKAPEACKTRLSQVLGDAERQTLVATMLHRTVSAAQAVVGREQVLLLGPSHHGLAPDIRLLTDPGRGLNSALASARDTGLREGVRRLLIVSADLPTIEPDDVAALLDIPANAIACGPDRAGVGTNALSMPLPAAAQFRFGYGESSFAAHRGETARLGLPFRVIDRRGLGLDIDRPEDLALWRHGAMLRS